MAFLIYCLKQGKGFQHDFAPATKEAAEGVGRELVRDGVADKFEVYDMTHGPGCPSGCTSAVYPDPDQWGDDWPRCSSCGYN